MQRFGRGPGNGGFAALLRKAGGKNIDKPLTGMRTPGARPEAGGSSGNRKPDNAATLKHMDARDNSGSRAGRRGSGAHDAPRRAPISDPEHRIARGSPGTSGREIHHKTIVKRKSSVPGHISVGPHRSGTSSQKLSGSGNTKMSTELHSRPGVPGHVSVINRPPAVKPGGYKHSRSRVSNLAGKLNY